MNPLMLIPFVGAPITNAIIAWFALSSGLVDKAMSVVPWTTPAPLGASWAAGWTFAPMILVLVNFAVSFVIWLPFYRMYEKQLLSEESSDKEIETEQEIIQPVSSNDIA